MNKNSQNQKSIIVRNKKTDCVKLFEFLDDYVKSNDISEGVHNDLRLVIEETFVNIASYSHKNDDTQTVTIELRSTINTVSITFTDAGIAFNPITDCDKDIENDDHCEGGMGIHIIKSLSDNLEYHRIDERNVFTVTKHYTINQEK